MPPKLEKETLVLLMNIGVTCSTKQINSILLEKIKHITKRIIEKKIFLRPKDEIAVILMGSSVTKNSLNTEHVEEFIDFQIPNWNLIEKIMHLHETSWCSNWVEALVATVNYINKNAFDNSMRKVVLMSDFNEEHDIILQFQADAIAKTLCTKNIELLTIGEESLDERPETSLKISEMFLKDVHKKINGQHITFNNAISDLRFYLEVPTNSIPWYCTLELIDIKISIVSYIKVTDTKKFPTWKTAKDNEKVVSVRDYSDKQRTMYKKDETVAGYKYGGIFIPVEKNLEEAMSYKSGEKSYRIHTFTKRKNVGLEYWQDNTSRVVLPSSQNAEKPFYSLVEAMRELDVVAIVRKVNNVNSTPKMVLLFPCIDIPDEPWCLVEISLPFAEDRRIMDARPLKSVIKQLSNEQNEAVDNLLDSLILPDTEDSYVVEGNQCFLPGFVSDPAVQHRWHMLSYRALNPDKPLPPMEDYLQKILESPFVKEKSKDPFQRIAKLFQLESIDPKAKQKSKSERKDNVQDDNKINIEKIIKTDDKIDIEDSFKELPVTFMDTSDIDLNELADNI